MSRATPSAITIADGKISVDAKPPVPKLRRSAETDHRSLFALARIAS